MENKSELSILSAKLETTLKGRSKDINSAIAQIERTGSLLDDFVKPVKELTFTNDMASGGVRMNFDYLEDVKGSMITKHANFGLHDNATSQVAEKFGVPAPYLRTLVGGKPWEKALSTVIMNEHAANIVRERVLIRSIEGQVRGFLSDKYRRLNSMEIFMAFLLAAQATESVLVDAHSGETKGFMEIINPNIIQFDTPQNGRNYGCMGARIRNSDFGDGALEVYVYMLMVKCMNGLVGESKINERHLGGRIPDNIKISEDTYKKDTAAKAALVGDVMKAIYAPEMQDAMVSKIQDASAVQVDLIKEVERLPKLGLTEGEANLVGKVLMENNPANGLEGSPSLWKLVQGLTAVARDAEPERKRALEQIASKMLIK